MLITLEPALEELAHTFGYQSALDFTRIQLKSMAAQKVAYYKGRTDLYEQKYTLSFDEFVQRVPDREDLLLKRFGLIEKEDDLMDWEDSLHSVRYYQQQLDSLENGSTL